ncbi:hypothetical protein Hanom_Chr07g00628471 [Helianthus anomalus]
MCFMLVGAAKSSKSASRFSLTDLQDIASPKSLKKDRAASRINLEPKGMSTRGKGTKRKKPKFAEVQIFMDQRLAEAEEKNLDFQKIALPKDKKISSLEKDINMLKKELLLAEITTQK